MKSRILPLADEDVREAIAYYDRITAGLGDRFLVELKAAIRVIEELPQCSPVIAKDVRKKVLLEFPYTLFYRVTDVEVLVLAVAHHSKRPGFWSRRMRSPEAGD